MRMKIHEHQGKELLRGFDVPVAAGGAFFSAAEAADFAGRLFADGARAVAVKAQIHAGGAAKAAASKSPATRKRRRRRRNRFWG